MTIYRATQRRIECSHAQTRQTPLHLVHDARPLANQALPLPVRSLGILLLNRWDRYHAAVIGLATQPANESTLEQLSVETVGLRPPMLARHRDASRVHDVDLNVMGPQPPRQPEAVPPSLEGNGDSCDRAS